MSRNPYSNLKSFATDGISNLSVEDKLEILAAKSPMEEIFKKVNFNPDNTSSHNVLYEDLESDNCSVYRDGEWIDCDVDVVAIIMIITKIKDIVLIYNELKCYLKDETIKIIDEYLRNGCRTPEIRKRKCKPSSVLKSNITIEKIKRDLKEK